MRKTIIPLMLSSIIMLASCGGSSTSESASKSPTSNDQTVSVDQQSHGITVTYDSALLSVDLSATSAKEGEEIALTITLNEEKEVIVNSVTANGEELSEGLDGVYTFTMPNKDVSIKIDAIELDSETVLFNVLEALGEMNFRIVSDGLYDIDVVSENEIIFDYGKAYEAQGAKDAAYFSKDNEAFHATLGQAALEDLTFLGFGTVAEGFADVMPFGWANFTEDGSLTELFTHKKGDDLSYQTDSEALIYSVLYEFGMDEDSIYEAMQGDVTLTMTLDDFAFESIALDVVFDSSDYDDVEVTITDFGEVEHNAQVAAWFQNPTYPTKTDWDEEEAAYIEALFGEDADESILPFPSDASYATTLIADYFYQGEVIVMDPHGTEEMVDEYVKALNSLGHSCENENGAYVCEIVLNETTYHYAELSVYFDSGKGFVVEACSYYNPPTMSGLHSANVAVTSMGFPGLAEDPALIEWTTFVYTASMEEMKNTDYDGYFLIEVSFNDLTAATTYVEAYRDTLLQGNFGEIEDFDESIYYANDDGAAFSYEIDEDENTLYMVFSKEHIMTLSEVNLFLEEMGFVTLPTSYDHTSLGFVDFTEFAVALGLPCDGMYYLNIAFDSNGDLNSFVNDYIASLTTNGYEYNAAALAYIFEDLNVMIQANEIDDENQIAYATISFAIQEPQSLEDLNALLADNSFPTLSFEDGTEPDLAYTDFGQAMEGMDAYILVNLTFSSAEDAAAFLVSFNISLTEAGFTFDSTLNAYIKGNTFVAGGVPEEGSAIVVIQYVVITPFE